MPFFGDFNKKSKDLFTKEYVSDLKVKVEDQSGKDSPKLTVNLTKKNEASRVSGDYELKFNVPYVDVKAKANTEGVVFVETETKNFGVQGLVVTEKFDSERNIEVNLEYSNNGVFTKLAFVPNALVKGSVAGTSGDFSGGIEGSLNLAKGTRGIDGVFAYTRTDNVVTAGTRSGGNEFFVSYYRRVPAQNLQVAAEVAIQSAQLNNPSVTVGLEQAYDNNFTYKLKLDAAKLDVHAVAIHKLRSNVTLNTGASVNLTTLAPKVGFGLTISN